MQHWYAGREVSHPEQASVRLHPGNQNGVQLVPDRKCKHIDGTVSNTQHKLAFVMSTPILTCYRQC